MRPHARLLLAVATTLVVLLQALAPGLHRVQHRHAAPAEAAFACSCGHHHARCEHDPAKANVVLQEGGVVLGECAFCVLLARGQHWVPMSVLVPTGPAAGVIAEARTPCAPTRGSRCWAVPPSRAPPIS